MRILTMGQKVVYSADGSHGVVDRVCNCGLAGVILGASGAKVTVLAEECREIGEAVDPLEALLVETGGELRWELTGKGEGK